MGGTFNLATAPPCCLAAHLAGVLHGSLTRAQLEDARRAAQDAELHRRAFELVQAAARQPSHDALEEARRPRRPEWLDPSEPWPFIPDHLAKAERWSA
jgi:hypothetical protein